MSILKDTQCFFNVLMTCAIEVINKLLTEKPQIQGIALPGMPSGSPGMPGPKAGPFVIYTLGGAEGEVYMTI